MNTSDDIVSETICKALLEHSLVSPDDATDLRTKLAKGQMKESDWITMFRFAIQSAGENKDASENKR